MNKKLFFSSYNQNGRTPKDLYDNLDKEFNFDFDPCPKDPNFDGLSISWLKSNFINPPFKTQRLWIKKAYEEEIRFIKGRLKFEQYNNPAPFPSMIVIFNGNLD